MSDYLYTVVTESDGTKHYFETYLNPNGIWSEGRVDYRVKTRELSEEEWLLSQVLNC